MVSGSGPSGSVAAYRCSKLGLRTLLLERHPMPRPKCCAGGLLVRAERQLPFEVPSNLVEKEIKGIAIQMKNYRKEFDFGETFCRIVKRDRFDQFLARKAEDAGTELWENARAQSLIEGRNEIEVITTKGSIHAKTMIVAEGVTSRSARALFGRYPSKNIAIGVATNVDLQQDAGDKIEFHFIDTPFAKLEFRPFFPLNGWMFPHMLGANIGVVAKGASREKLFQSVRDIQRMTESKFGKSPGNDNITAHPIPLVPRSRLHSARALAVGDAAGFANPLTGEGMTYAIKSGLLAAEAISNALNNNDTRSAFHRYDSECEKHIARDLRAASMLSPFLHNLLNLVDSRKLFENLQENKRLMDTCVGIVQGKDNWAHLAIQALTNFPSLFLSSLRTNL